jgi:hypothetical protein
LDVGRVHSNRNLAFVALYDIEATCGLCQSADNTERADDQPAIRVVVCHIYPRSSSYTKPQSFLRPLSCEVSRADRADSVLSFSRRLCLFIRSQSGVNIFTGIDCPDLRSQIVYQLI